MKYGARPPCGQTIRRKQGISMKVHDKDRAALVRRTLCALLTALLLILPLAGCAKEEPGAADGTQEPAGNEALVPVPAEKDDESDGQEEPEPGSATAEPEPGSAIAEPDPGADMAEPDEPPAAPRLRVTVSEMPNAGGFAAAWDPVDGADGYEVQTEEKDPVSDVWGAAVYHLVTECAYEETCAEDTDCRVAVRAYRETGNTRTYGAWSAALDCEVRIGPPEPPEIPAETPAEETGFSYSQIEDWEFYFESGAGGWGTSLRVRADGSFTGQFHDSDLGTTDDDYPNGTVYFCYFSGHFTQPVARDDYTYEAEVRDIAYEDVPDTEEIRDGVRFVAALPYGIDGAGTVLFYLPGKPLDTLPEDYRTWCMYALMDVEDGKLPFYGIFNEDEGNGFFSFPIDYDREELILAYDAADERSEEIERQLDESILSQLEANQLSYEYYEIWDDLLNTIWRHLKKTLDTDTMATLTAEQLAWIGQKEAEVKSAEEEVGSGSMKIYVGNLKAAALTKERVRQLMDWYVY